MRGSLYGIGVGPGEPELLTIKALNYIKRAEVIILPAAPREECHAYRTVRKIFPEIEKKQIFCLPFAMTKEKEEAEACRRQIYQRISGLLEQEKNVAFLTIGDPCIYSTYSYIHRWERERGGNPVTISGVPSFCAAAAALGISLADNGEPIHIIPASYEIEESLKLTGTKIYMKAGRKLKSLKHCLQQAAQKEELKVYSVANCGMPGERAAYGAENIEDDSGYLTIIIVK